MSVEAARFDISGAQNRNALSAINHNNATVNPLGFLNDWMAFSIRNLVSFKKPQLRECFFFKLYETRYIAKSNGRSLMSRNLLPAIIVSSISA
jgi:hypothetical protein